MMQRIAFIYLCTLLVSSPSQAQESKPLKALLIAGGCCHDYAGQTKVLSDGIQARANVQVDVVWTDDKSPNPPLPIYAKDNWADGYDVIIHDECAAANRDIETVKRILAGHQTIPAVHLHCAMHSFRTGTDHWFKHLGLQSSAHGPHLPVEVDFVDQEHLITKGFETWLTGKEELYNNVKVYDAHPLAVGTQKVNRGGKTVEDKAVVVWTNEKQGARSFSTSLGHYTEVVEDPRYLDLVTRGLLWACGKLTPEYLTPFKGQNKIHFNEGVAEAKQQMAEKKNAEIAAKLKGKMPKDAALVKVTASSTQSGNELISSIDQDSSTRWCASGGSYPQWLAFEFEKPMAPESIRIKWEFDNAYRYKVEGSVDGSVWLMLLDQSANADTAVKDYPLVKNPPVKHVRITGLGSTGGWCSIREVSLKGKGFSSVWPAMIEGGKYKPFAKLEDPYKNSGNIEPKIVNLSPEKEAEYLKLAKVPEGFEATLFAAPPAVNYPVFVAAAPDGTLYVSSDGNGSLGRNPDRGRVIRLRDLDGDGRADETKVFCKVDAPRGLVWDQDRLYLMHPPHLSVFIDKDRDGVADEQKILVKNLAFGYDKRPADHTTNGLSMGVDGYLYVAGGDFGFMEAEGSDGTKLQHRGGGVIRVRPDGSDLQLYSTGTRNILEVAISPRMDLFARDNTNDGGGWDVRFHHFTGGEDHGYPRLYKNFNDECVQPLADYGGGSGCGAVYLDEPGFGDWNDAPLTADWGKGGLFHHQVEPNGATFKEARAPEKFVHLERTSDADVDAMSRLYCASWRGATFNWNGPNAGFIVRVTPKDFKPEPLPEFSKLNDQQLADLFDSPSSRRRMAAQRELVRRKNDSADQLLSKGLTQHNTERNLIDRIRNEALTTNMQVVAALSHDDSLVRHTAIRELAKREAFAECFAALDEGPVDRGPVLRAIAMMHKPEVVDGLISRLQSATVDDLKMDFLSTLCRLHFTEGEWNGQSWGTRPDTRGPYYQPENWDQTDKITDVLHTELKTLDPADASELVDVMNRNRIKSDDATYRMIELASKDDSLIGNLSVQIMNSDSAPESAYPLLMKAVELKADDAKTLEAVGVSLSRYNKPQSIAAILKTLAMLDAMQGMNQHREAVRRAFFGSRSLQNQIQTLCAASATDSETAFWADAAIIDIAARKNASPEAKAICQETIDSGWAETSRRRRRLMKAAIEIRSHHLDDKIIAALEDTNTDVAQTAKEAVRHLRLNIKPKVKSPAVASMDVSEAIREATAIKGDRNLGEQLFTKANCMACHTVRKDVPQKGPYLGSIAQTYKRPELVTAILQPSKTIAQGFATTNVITIDGQSIIGFVTKESADEVVLRNAEAKEFTVLKDDIDIRKTSAKSVMPEGLMDKYTLHDLASIVDYLQWLAKK